MENPVTWPDEKDWMYADYFRDCIVISVDQLYSRAWNLTPRPPLQ